VQVEDGLGRTVAWFRQHPEVLTASDAGTPASLTEAPAL